MSFGFEPRRSKRPSSTLTIPPSAARALREAHALDRAEYRERAGRLEFRIHPGADWRPIEDAALVTRDGPVQLAALAAEESHE
jgi:hypothetical protein